MPRRPRRLKKLRVPISEHLKKYLLTGEHTNEDFEVFLLLKDWVKLKAIWNSHREELMPEFIEENPGKRPWAWWRFDAPRCEVKMEAWFDGTFPETRKRVGGTGTPDYQFSEYVLHFEKGIPKRWLTQSQVDYYNRRAKDIHENPMKIKYKEGDFQGVAIDPEDPPMFESEAAYLKRHGLLTTIEEKWLKPDDFEPETIGF